MTDKTVRIARSALGLPVAPGEAPRVLPTPTAAVAAARRSAAPGEPGSLPPPILDRTSGARPGNVAEALPKAGPFREDALRARVEQQRDAVEPLPAISGGRLALLAFLSTTLLALLCIGYFGRVEVTSVAPGALVVRGGPRPVLTQASGEVAELQVKAGDRVTAGQPIARIDATELLAREQRQQEQLTRLRAEHERQSAEKAALYERGVHALRKKRALLVQRTGLKGGALTDRKKRASQVALLAEEGAASRSDALNARDAARSSHEELLLLRQQVADIDLELSDRKRNHDSEIDALSRQLKDAEASLDEARALIRLTAVRAPVGGRVESLLVTAGQVVSAGAALARIIPDGALSSVVAFAPAKDAAFLKTDLAASVEFASFPVSEFGKAKARVSRVSGDVATREEITAVLGVPMEDAVVRVELELVPTQSLTKVSHRLRSGERLTARLNTRERRIITLLFDFLRKWYPT